MYETFVFKSLINELSTMPENLNWKKCKRFSPYFLVPPSPIFKYLSVFVFVFLMKQKWTVTASVSLKCPCVPEFAPLGCWRSGWPWGGVEGRGRSAGWQPVLKEGARYKRLNGHKLFAEYFIIRQAPPSW